MARYSGTGELSRYKGLTALVEGKYGLLDICTIREVVYDHRTKQNIAYIEKHKKKSSMSFSNLWDLITLKNSSSSTSVSLVPMRRVYPLFDIQSQDECCNEAGWTTVPTRSKSKSYQRDLSERNLVEITLDKLKPEDFVVLLTDDYAEPMITGKVRAVLQKEPNLPPYQLYVDVLFDRMINFHGQWAKLLPQETSDFRWHLRVELKHVKKLGEEIIFQQDSSGATTMSSAGMDQKLYTTEVLELRKNTMTMLEGGILFRWCHRFDFGSDLKLRTEHETIMDSWRWKVLFCKSVGRIDFCYEIYSEKYIECTFEEESEELESYTHSADCTKLHCTNKFMVNEKKCVINTDDKLVVIRPPSPNHTSYKASSIQLPSSSKKALPYEPIASRITRLEIKLETGSKYGTENKIGDQLEVVIEAGINSCYLDCALFTMFHSDDSFDKLLVVEEESKRSSMSATMIDSLKNIACFLRQKMMVPSYMTNELRQSLSGINPEFISSFMDVEELFSVLFKEIFLRHAFELNNGGRDAVHQILVPPPTQDGQDFVSRNFPLIKTTQEMLEQSFNEYGVKFIRKPEPVLMLKMPFCNGKAYFGSEGVVPSKYIKLESVMESTRLEELKDSQMELYAVVCLKSSHYTCFVKSSSSWVYFDSALKHKPQITVLQNFEKDLEVVELEALERLGLNRDLKHQNYIDFLLQNIYLCFYR